MCADPCYECIPLKSISDETAVEILDFFQVFTMDFEIRYGNPIRRYYDARARHNIVQVTPSAASDDPPFLSTQGDHLTNRAPSAPPNRGLMVPAEGVLFEVLDRCVFS